MRFSFFNFWTIYIHTTIGVIMGRKRRLTTSGSKFAAKHSNHPRLVLKNNKNVDITTETVETNTTTEKLVQETEVKVETVTKSTTQTTKVKKVANTTNKKVPKKSSNKVKANKTKTKNTTSKTTT